MFAPKLSTELFTAVLNQLNYQHGQPNLNNLDRLIGAFVRTVPWESAFRIVKRDEYEVLASCSRWPDEFWESHLQGGAGGTCFETNFAFSALLNELGYEGYLTINDMEERVGCHTAIIVLLDGQKWMVDAGFPIYIPLPLDSGATTYRNSIFYNYTIRPLEEDRYQIERRPHPNIYCFTLIDKPVTIEAYRQATTADYGPDGHFLQRVIIHKILDEKSWRFTSSELPQQFNQFDNGHKVDEFIEGDLAAAVAKKFDMDEAVVRRALELIPDVQQEEDRVEGDSP